ncbi:MAG TPA: TonB family protein [Vicinamibacterales bacterium]|jgi:TonB family protein
MDVSDILRDRMQEPDGLQRMLTISVIAHGALLALVMLGPIRLLDRPIQQSRNVMTISISGAGEGPRNGGFTAAAAQPVQSVLPSTDLSKREPVRPPAAVTPEMVLPTTKTPPKNAKSPTQVVKTAPDDAKGRTPTRGAEVSSGNAVAFTGARGQGFGLSTGGGAGGGVLLDVGNFCCPDYLATLIDRIQSAWQHNQNAAGDAVIKFTILRNGQITDPSIERSSGATTLDLAALRAVVSTKTLAPLPAAYTNPTLTLHMTFQYTK